MLSRIRAIWALIAFVLTVSITILLMYLFRKQNRKIRQIWAKMQAYLLGYKIEVKGEISKDAKLLLLNHQSLLDIVVIEDLHPNNTCWVAKKEIEQIPFFGRILDPTRMIAIDRSNRRSLVKLIKEAKDRVESGRVIAIFPEGTRSKGDKLLKFQSGAKVLAEKLNLLVQPIVILGSRNILDSKELRSNWGTLRVVFLNPVNPNEDENWYENVKIKMEEVFTNEMKNPPKFW